MITENIASLIVPAPKATRVKYQTIDDLSDANKKLYRFLLDTSREQFIEFAKNGDRYCATELFEADVTDLLNTVGLDKDSTFARIYTALLTIQRTSIEWETNGLNNGVRWHSVSLFSEIRLVNKNGKITLSWAYPPSLFEMVSNPQGFNNSYGKDLDAILN